MICGVLLAGGEGRRFGGDKLVERLADGVPLALASAAPLADAVDARVAVIRPGRDWLVRALAETGWTPLVTADAERGMGASLAAGIRAAPMASGWLIGLADMPAVAPATARSVAAALRAGATAAVPMYEGRRGHPVGFAASLRDRLLRLDGDRGARDVLAEAEAVGGLAGVPVDDPGILLDVDTPADLAAVPRKEPHTAQGED